MDELVDLISKRVDRSYDIPLNVAVWISFKPIIKIYLSIGTGFLLAKKNVLTPELSKGISRLVLLIFMPCLLFNNIVSQIKDTDIKIFGVVVFTGFIYYMIGLGWGLVIRLVSPIPRAWFGGLILCCMLNNCSDLPLAYVQTIGESPLLPSNVAQRGESYCVLMVIIFIVFTFNLGGTRLIEWDATRQDPDRELPTVPPVSWTSIKRVYHRAMHKVSPHHGSDKAITSSKSSSSTTTNDKQQSKEAPDDSNLSQLESGAFSDHEQHEAYSQADHLAYLQREQTTDSQQRVRRERPYGSTEVYYARRGSAVTDDVYEDSRSAFTVGPDAPIAFQNMGRHLSRSEVSQTTRRGSRSSQTSVPTTPAPTTSESTTDQGQQPRKSGLKAFWAEFRRRWFKMKAKNHVTTYICDFLEDLFLPQMMALISGITVAMIPWVRRVFVKGQDIHHFHDAPDHMPPLSFVMEFLSFFAAAQVPLGLMLLGGTIASLRIGKMVKGFWRTLVLIVLFKLAILPIIACAWIHRIREIGWVDKSDPVVPIVLAVGASTPSATVQIYLTLSWIDPTKESLELNCLAISLMAQYALLPITLTFLMTYVVMHWV